MGKVSLKAMYYERCFFFSDNVKPKILGQRYPDQSYNNFRMKDNVKPELVLKKFTLGLFGQNCQPLENTTPDQNRVTRVIL